MTKGQEPSDKAGMSSAEKRRLLKRILEQRAADGGGHSFPLSYGQQALWFIYRSAPESSAYNWVFEARILSPIDSEALRRAVEQLFESHGQLRVRFREENDGPRQQVVPMEEVPFELCDVSGWSQDRLDNTIREETSRPFDLNHGPVIRFRLYGRSDNDHLLLIVAHHIVMDERSAWVMMEDLNAHYSALQPDGGVSPAPSGGDSFRDFVSWEHQMLTGPQGDRLATYWQQQLAGAPVALDLPTDFPRPRVQSYLGDSHPCAVQDGVVARLAELARQEKTSLFVVMLAALDVLLWRYTGQDDLLVGIPMATRSRTGFERTVGYFVNSVVLRSRLTAAMTVRELIRQARGTVFEALENQDYPFAYLVEKLHPHRDPSRSPIFQVMLGWHKVEGTADRPALLDLGDLEAETIAYPQQEGVFDLYLEVTETQGRLAGMLKYDTALFSPNTISRMAGHLEVLLEGFAGNPEQQVGSLPLLTPDERRQITVEWNQTQLEFSRNAKLGELIERQVEKTPEATAVVFEGEELSYQDLNRRANRLAHHLRERGAGPGSAVGLYLDRSLDILVTLLGILKSGAAYVPLDPGYPVARLSYMIADAQVGVLVTSRALAGTLSHGGEVVLLDADRSEIESQSDQDLERLGSAEDLAYIIYTSGSTGMPKGVGVRHRNAVNFLESMREQPGMTSRDSLLAVTTISFDIHVLELFLPLLVGGRVEVASREIAADGRLLLERLRTGGATIMQATPTTWQMMIASGWEGRIELKALCGGEALSSSLAQTLVERTTAVWNMYGPTETTVWSSVGEVTSMEEGITIGTPIANTQLYVLDERLEPLPIGITGELYIGGEGVASGYVNLPEQTEARFLPDPFSGQEEARLYRTGDLARYRDNGELEILGRVDHQVKLRGFRVELGEIEARLRSLESIREVLVMVREDRPGNPTLVAYLIPRHTDETPSSAELVGFLRESLPPYMVPAHYVFMDQFPLAPNGKIDRQALPAPRETPRSQPREGGPLISATEAMLIGIWKKVLGLSEIEVYDTFFDLGGHSLLSLQVVDRFEKATGVRLNPTVLINQTVRQIAARYDEMPEQVSTRQSLPGKILGALKNGVFRTGSET